MRLVRKRFLRYEPLYKTPLDAETLGPTPSRILTLFDNVKACKEPGFSKIVVARYQTLLPIFLMKWKDDEHIEQECAFSFQRYSLGNTQENKALSHNL